MRHVASLITAALLSFSFACGSSSEDVAPTGMRVDKICVKTECDAKRDDDNKACSRCLDACLDASYACDPSSACRHSCSGKAATCSDEERATCAEETFKAEVGSAASAPLEAACKRFLDHVVGCGVTLRPNLDSSVCSTWAKAEKPEMAAVYDCYANTPCGEKDTCAPPETTLGKELCDGLAGKCGAAVCTEQGLEALNRDGSWLRDDVIAAAKSCVAQESCDDAKECFVAWNKELHR